VGLTLDLLVDSDLIIEKEFVVPISQNLMANKGVSLENIKNVFSHSQAISQCQKYIEKHKLKTHFTLSTAVAAKSIKNINDSGAIGSKKAAEIYGLEIVDENIQDTDNNQTRFVALGKKKTKPTGNDKTSILFTLHDNNPGRLYETLEIFAKNKINLSKIVSRPLKEGLGTYIFFVDFEGHSDDKKIKAILEKIEEKVYLLKVLGSYPIAEIGNINK
jgi:prephenate dehydratase